MWRVCSTRVALTLFLSMVISPSKHSQSGAGEAEEKKKKKIDIDKKGRVKEKPPTQLGGDKREKELKLNEMISTEREQWRRGHDA